MEEFKNSQNWFIILLKIIFAIILGCIVGLISSALSLAVMTPLGASGAVLSIIIGFSVCIFAIFYFIFHFQPAIKAQLMSKNK